MIKLRGRIPDTVEEIYEKLGKLTLREMERTKDGYRCLYNQESYLYDIKEVDSDFNRERVDLDDVCKEKRYLFKTDCPCDCPFMDICNKTRV